MRIIKAIDSSFQRGAGSKALTEKEEQRSYKIIKIHKEKKWTYKVPLYVPFNKVKFPLMAK